MLRIYAYYEHANVRLCLRICVHNVTVYKLRGEGINYHLRYLNLRSISKGIELHRSTVSSFPSLITSNRIQCLKMTFQHLFMAQNGQKFVKRLKTSKGGRTKIGKMPIYKVASKGFFTTSDTLTS